MPLQVTFILDDEGQPEYFRTRSFVAQYVGENPVDSDVARRFQRLQATKSLPVPDLSRLLPSPRVPFITPPTR
jgi:hypothetical protein